MKYFLPIYLAAYIAAAFVWRSYVVWKKTNVNPVIFKGSDDAHDFIGRVFKLVFVLVVLVVISYSLFPSSYQFTVPIEWLKYQPLGIAGVVLLLVSLAWTVIAQSQMGLSWRIGIDKEHRTPLVETGIFRRSRNPIFVGMILTLLGLFLVLPNALTLLALVLGVVVIAIQVRLEEQHLLKLHGDAYRQYQHRVRRWL